MQFHKFNLRLALCLLAAVTALPSSLFGSCGPDLSTQFKIQLGRQYFSNGAVHQSADITNLGSSRKGPLYFVVSNMPAGVTESPYTWTAGCEPGAQLIRIYLGYGNQFPGGATKSLMLNFYNAQVPVSYTYKIIDGSALQNPRVVPGDYDGDGRADLALYNQPTAVWTIKQSFNQQIRTVQFGAPGTDRFVVGDFDGDLKEDLAVYRPSVGGWFIQRSSDGVVMSFVLGVVNVEIPVPADYDGDGYTDLAVYNPNTGVFRVWQSTNGQLIMKQFGMPGDKAVVADYDGDGKADIAIFRPSQWAFYILQSHTNQVYSLSTSEFKNGIPFAADIDGDGRADMCAYNPNNGKVGIVYFNGLVNVIGKTVDMGGNQMPVAADFSGDHEADFATFDPATAHWVVDGTMNAPVQGAVATFAFGTPPNDMPVMTVPAALW